MAIGQQSLTRPAKPKLGAHPRAVFWASVRLIAFSAPVAIAGIIGEGRDPVVARSNHLAGSVLVGLIVLATVGSLTTPGGRQMLAGRGARPRYMKRQLRPGFVAYCGLAFSIYVGLLTGVKLLHRGDAGDVGVFCWALVLLVGFADVAWCRLRGGRSALLHAVAIVAGYALVGFVCLSVLAPLGSTRISHHRACLTSGQS